MSFFLFRQNNSGGSFDISDAAGIGPCVWVEAADTAHANLIAQQLGIYFDGVEEGRDCVCCGNRWYEAHQADSEPAPHIDPECDFRWHDTVYVHCLNGEVRRIRRAHCEPAALEGLR